jgi:hypothetical protein
MSEYKFIPVTPAGFKVYRGESNHIYGYAPTLHGEGLVYKDEKAFMSGRGIAYIQESKFEFNDEHVVEIDGHKVLLNDDASNLAGIGYTRADLFEGVEREWKELFMLDDEQVEHATRVLFSMMDWMCLESYLDEKTRMEDIILRNFDVHDFRGFTNFQREAIAMDEFPANYANREPYMSELAMWSEEFNEATIWGEDDGDEQTQAELQYQEERRKGISDNILEFAEHFSQIKPHLKRYVH